MTNTVKIVCLGQEFDSEEHRRDYFRDELRKKLPELKQIEGFPIGDDEDILNLSDPPYYTACPNPWINDFINEWEQEKAHIKSRSHDFNVDEPYGHDVKEGVNNPVYNAHSYHTKVPHPAIMRFLLHYTQPGDIVLDSFAGTGMCGVAANACENPSTELKHQIDSEWKDLFGISPNWGKRRAILSDLSPIASFISNNFNSDEGLDVFLDTSDQLFKEIDEECNWMFQTNHIGVVKGKINYTVWSECITCPNCGNEIIYYDAVVNPVSGEVSKEFICNKCKINLKKSDCEKLTVTVYDDLLEKYFSQAKYYPVLINYFVGTKRYWKKLDKDDLNVISNINLLKSSSEPPLDRMPEGDEARRNDRTGIEHVYQFYTKRNLYVITKLFEFARKRNDSKKLMFIITSILPKLTNMNRYMPQHGSRALVGPMANTLYIPPMFVENNSLDQFLFQRNKISRAIRDFKRSVVSIHSATKNIVKDNSIDYIFTDRKLSM